MARQRFAFLEVRVMDLRLGRPAHETSTGNGRQILSCAFSIAITKAEELKSH
jgi:hypothetical protein